MKHEFLGIIIYATLAALPIYGGILLLREISADPESTEHTLIPPQYRLLGVGGGNSPQTPSQTNSAGSGLPPKSSLRLFAEVFIYIALILLIILIADRVGGGAYAPPDPLSGGGAYAPPDPLSGGGGGDIGAESESAGLLGGLFGGSTRGSGGTSVPPWRTSRHIPIAHILFILFVADGKVGEALRGGAARAPQPPSGENNVNEGFGGMGTVRMTQPLVGGNSIGGRDPFPRPEGQPNTPSVPRQQAPTNAGMNAELNTAMQHGMEPMAYTLGGGSDAGSPW